MRVVVDVNLAPLWASRLTTLGQDAQHWSQIGSLDASDSQLLTWAAEHAAVVLTCDLDFGAMLAASQARGPSVVLLRARDVMSDQVVNQVASVLVSLATDLS